jgi:hypothetical protein
LNRRHDRAGGRVAGITDVDGFGSEMHRS